MGCQVPEAHRDWKWGGGGEEYEYKKIYTVFSTYTYVYKMDIHFILAK
jgi:hypothetical protein